MKLNLALIPAILSGTLFTSDHQKIAYRHYNVSHEKVIIIAHGFYNSKDAILLKKLKDNLMDSYDVIMFDFRGHGKSSGLFYWTSKEELDLKTQSFNDLKAEIESEKEKFNKIDQDLFRNTSRYILLFAFYSKNLLMVYTSARRVPRATNPRSQDP